MIIVKILNNNVIHAQDNQGQEVVVMGKGIGYQVKLGDSVDSEKIEKVFVLQTDDQHLSDILKEISTKEMSLVNEIITIAEEKLNHKFSANLFITLADHIHFAIKRTQAGERLSNPLAWNVKRLYKQEYRIGIQGVMLIEDAFDIQLHDSEAASLALHIVNASKEGGKVEETYQITQIIEEILKIIELEYGQKFDEDSLSFSRLITHLHFFAQRVNQSTFYEGKNDDFLFDQVQLTYPKAFNTSKKIKKFIEKKYQYPLEKEEQVYLTIHIQRITHDE